MKTVIVLTLTFLPATFVCIDIQSPASGPIAANGHAGGFRYGILQLLA